LLKKEPITDAETFSYYIISLTVCYTCEWADIANSKELIERNQYKINASITVHDFHISKPVLASPHKAHYI